MNEEVARKKLCPTIKAYCIASACMMWRWSQYEGDHLNVITSTTHGYCGLGGKP